MSIDINVTDQQTKFTLDDILRVVGKFGPYQWYVYVQICSIILLTSSFNLGFVFTTGQVKYRCYVPECENRTTANYSEDWLTQAVPFENGHPKSCLRYAPIFTDAERSCYNSKNFNRSYEIECGDVIFDDYENTIVNEFDLSCDKDWEVPLVGTIHFTANFVKLFISGYISDVYGRKIVLIVTTIIGGFLGILRSFSWNYIFFVVNEFIAAFITSEIYTVGFVMAIEYLNPELRIVGGVIIFISATSGIAVTGLLAWWLRDWRYLLRVNSTPVIVLGLVCMFYIPESFRWLLSKGRNQILAKHLLASAKFNRIKLSSEMKNVLEKRPHDILLDAQEKECSTEDADENNFMAIFRYPSFLARIVICAYCWLTNVFVYYGLSFTAVTIGGNKFTDFVFVSLIEVPALIFVAYIGERVGRKSLLIPALLISGICILSAAFIPDIYWLKLTIFLFGKFSITISFSMIYTITSEIFPTKLRNSLLGLCSAVGRLGSIIASQMLLLQKWNELLPIYLFAGSALFAGLLSLTFPETKNTKLPDTISEAMIIGKLQKADIVTNT